MKLKYIVSDDSEEIKDYTPDAVKINDELLSDADKALVEDYVVYNIATTSDKLINRRIYPDMHVRNTIYSDSWIKPFAKPFLKNHDLRVEPLGRAVASFYIAHDDLSVFSDSGNEVLPAEVIETLKVNGFLNDGTGSVIIKKSVTKDALEKIKNGVYLTTSQSSATDAMNCSICGQDYRKCEHLVGDTYNGKQAHLITGALFPIEDSAVNNPANNSSVIVLFHQKTKVATIFGATAQTIAKDSQQEVVPTVQDNKPEKDQMEVLKTMDKHKKFIQTTQARTKKLLKDFLGTEIDVETLVADFDEAEAINLLSLVETLADCHEEKFKTLTEENKNLKDENTELQTKLTLNDSAAIVLGEAEDLETVIADKEVNCPHCEAKLKVTADETILLEEPKIQDEEGNVEDEEVNTQIQDEVIVPNFLDSENSAIQDQENLEDKTIDNMLKNIFNKK